MCGIVGYVGSKRATDVILSGLSKLEYRGYDSAGVAINTGSELVIRKYAGRLSVLEQELEKEPVAGSLGIGHIRWATHGVPTVVNSHPHTNMNGTIAIVHNGIIENYMQIKDKLIEKGYVFKSDTDTEVLAHLVDYYYKGDLFDALHKVLGEVRGSYAIGAIAKDEPGRLIAARKDSPLIVGIGDGENFIASDIPALLNYTRNIYLIDDGEMVELTRDGVKVYDSAKNLVGKEAMHVEWDVEAASKGGYEHFMLKEIHEQPKSITETLTKRLDDKGFIKLDDIRLTREQLEGISKIYIVACGTAYHAGLVGRYAIEKFVKIPVEVDIASEFRYRDPFVDDKTLVIIVSQSGETLDTLAALKHAKSKGARILSITNVLGSSIARESDDVFYTWAGPEIAVASTKAYITQLVSFYMIALDMALKLGRMDEKEYKRIIEEIKLTSDKVQQIIEQDSKLEEIAKAIMDRQHGFFLGRGLDYNTAMEGSLKMKEVSYMHTEAFAGGELKHGSIALIEDGTPVIGIASQDNLFEKIVSNMKEVKARGAFVVAIAQEGNTEVEQVADMTFYIPKVDSLLASILTVVPLQLIAYHVSVLRGCDVDKPRNLAKSVTVE